MATNVAKQTVKEVEAYTYFNRKLIDAIAEADLYDKEKVARAQQQWELHNGQGPYLKHIKSLSEAWPPLRLLADFMEIGTSPLRWKKFETREWSQDDRDERASRTRVTRLDYLVDGKVESNSYEKIADLRGVLKEQSEEQSASHRKFRLFVVEDLSRDVIELLGARYDIEPAFFRDQIFDYAWYNTRDRWMDPPRLKAVTKRQRWLQIRFACARYFDSPESFKQGLNQFEMFNVSRRPEDDCNNNAIWDKPGSIVGLLRTRAAFWVRSAEGHPEGAVGVLLVDPTIEEGCPLWYGYRNWEDTPSMGSLGRNMPLPGPPRKSLYKDLIYWLEKKDTFTAPNSTDPAANIHVPIQALLHLICSEWLTIAEYIQTRLGQIEWEISYPEHFLDPGMKIDIALKKLHVWRRLVPLYREMLTETLQRVLSFPCHTTSLNSSGSDVKAVDNGSGSTNNTTEASSTSSSMEATQTAGITTATDPTDTANTATATNTTTMTPTTSTNSANPQPHCPCPLHDPTTTKKGSIHELREEFAHVHSCMEEYQQRIDRLTSVVTAIISIEDSRRGIEDTRRGIEDNQNVARLTWLATCFIPLSLIASIFSMQEDITKLQGIIGWYFLTALPIAALILGLALALTRPGVQQYFRKLWPQQYFRKLWPQQYFRKLWPTKKKV